MTTEIVVGQKEADVAVEFLNSHMNGETGQPFRGGPLLTPFGRAFITLRMGQLDAFLFMHPKDLRVMGERKALEHLLSIGGIRKKHAGGRPRKNEPVEKNESVEKKK